MYRSNSLEDEKGEGDNMLIFVDVENINTVSLLRMKIDIVYNFY